MKRKSIAVCVTGYDWECASRIINGIFYRCQELNINLLVFASMLKKPVLSITELLSANIINGETEIFNLINYKTIDGVIILGDTMIDKKTVYDIQKKCKENNIPHVNVNDLENYLDYNVVISNDSAMLLIMKHLVKDHKLTKINFIGGKKSNSYSDERLNAYKTVLLENNIPFEPKRVKYGGFWDGAVNCVIEFLQEGELPQAIVCANDSMALFVIEYLKSQGYKVPQDVIVTGYDGIEEGEVYVPSLTTVRPNYEKMGGESVNVISSLMNKKECPRKVFVESNLFCLQSCGCKEITKKDMDFFNVRNIRTGGNKQFNLEAIQMNLTFSNALTSSDIFKGAIQGAQSFNLDRIFICIRPELKKEPYVIPAKPYGISKQMMSMAQYGHGVPNGTLFNTEDYLPQNIFEGETPVFIAFSPIYYQDKFLGYTAIQPQYIKGDGDLFLIWLQSISNNIGTYYQRRELQILYMHDPLTNLYNRRGMENLLPNLLSMSKARGGYINVFCGDIDGLKVINDKYGHDSGDIAIKTIANSITKCFPGNSICMRTGGDEFSIIFYTDKSIDCQHYVDKLNSELNDFNKTSDLEYDVLISLGYYTENGKNIDDFEHVKKLADRALYKNKAERKALRI